MKSAVAGPIGPATGSTWTAVDAALAVRATASSDASAIVVIQRASFTRGASSEH